MIGDSLKKGFGFGLTSGTITTIGLMVGLYSVTSSKSVVIGGILMIAIADAFSDALGIHVSEEFEAKNDTREIWEATASTFFFKLVFSSAFIIPVLFLDLFTAILVSVIFGMTMIGIFSFKFAKERSANPWKAVIEHLGVASAVVVITYQIGTWISSRFG